MTDWSVHLLWKEPVLTKTRKTYFVTVPIFDDFSYHDTAEVEPKAKLIHGSGQSWSKVQYLDAGITFLQEGC